MNDLIGRLATGLALMLLALTLMLAGLAFLLLSALLVAAKFLGPVAATAVTGLLAFALALVLLLIARRTTRKRRSATEVPLRALPAGQGTASAVGDAVAAGSILAAEGRRLLAGRAKGATVAALALGLALGVSPRLRRSVWRLLR